MINRRAVVLGSLVLVCIALAGCKSSVPLAPDHLDAAAKNFTPEPGQGNLYVYRSAGHFGSAILCQVLIDNEAMGGLAPGTYFVRSLPSGAHSATVTGGENQATLPVTIEPGKNYFARIEAEWGMVSARWSIKPLSDEEGRKQVGSGKLAAGIAPPR